MSATSPQSPNENLYELSITRIFNAPRELVYEAFSDAEHTKQWMGPRGFVATHLEQDVRPGGKWRTCLHQVAEWNGRIIPDLWQGGVFKEVVPPERLVYTFAWDGQGGQPTRETVVTISFTEVDADNTRMDFHQAFFDSIEQRDGHNQGWNSGFDRLNEFVTTTKQLN
ncbi:MAG: SRPBCC domain-containing protein [Chthonomonadales bacterium]